MALAKIDDDFTFVGTKSELAYIFRGDLKLGDRAVVLTVPEGASHEQRVQMAQEAARIRQAGNAPAP